MKQLVSLMAVVMVAAILLAGWFLYRNTQLEKLVKSQEKTINSLYDEISALTTDNTFLVQPTPTP